LFYETGSSNISAGDFIYRKQRKQHKQRKQRPAGLAAAARRALTPPTHQNKNELHHAMG